ncbi:MAG: ZIP family metal transporter [Candidatus Nanohaloarchaea archaeon]
MNAVKFKPGKIELLGALSAVLLAVLTALTLGSAQKVVVIGWTAALAMFLGGLLARRELRSEKSIVWVYGISGGAALASIFYFVLPKALQLSVDFGAAGVLTGFLAGLALHSLGHKVSHSADHGTNALLSVSFHSASAGLIIGLIYQQLPGIGLALGIAIVSHKLPAGYMVVDRMHSREKVWTKLLLPATAVGSIALLSFSYPVALGQNLKALFFGFSSGIFIHLALDFIPNPEPESHLRKILTHEEDPLHHELDEITTHCVASTVAGVAVVTFFALLL